VFKAGGHGRSFQKTLHDDAFSTWVLGSRAPDQITRDFETARVRGW